MGGENRSKDDNRAKNQIEPTIETNYHEYFDL